MPTTKKHRRFVSEPMGEKTVHALPGIEKVIGKRLEDKGLDKASVVFGQFLYLRKNENRFREWLKDTCGASSKQSKACYDCLKGWFNAHM